MQLGNDKTVSDTFGPAKSHLLPSSSSAFENKNFTLPPDASPSLKLTSLTPGQCSDTLLKQNYTRNYVKSPLNSIHFIEAPTSSEAGHRSLVAAIHERLDVSSPNLESLDVKSAQLKHWMSSLIQVYGDWSTAYQSYFMMQLLRHTQTPTLQFLSNLLQPILKKDFLSLLPAEITSHILHHLDLVSLCRCARVNFPFFVNY
jgi:hypothetical protein